MILETICFLRDHGETRTPMPVKAPPPQDGVSTSFTTWPEDRNNKQFLSFTNLQIKKIKTNRPLMLFLK